MYKDPWPFIRNIDTLITVFNAVMGTFVTKVSSDVLQDEKFGILGPDSVDKIITLEMIDVLRPVGANNGAWTNRGS